MTEQEKRISDLEFKIKMLTLIINDILFKAEPQLQFSAESKARLAKRIRILKQEYKSVCKE